MRVGAAGLTSTRNAFGVAPKMVPSGADARASGREREGNAPHARRDLAGILVAAREKDGEEIFRGGINGCDGLIFFAA